MCPSLLNDYKLPSLEEVCKIRISKRSECKKIVLTNGCFDLLHAGHVYSLKQAAQLGDELWVAINSDSSVKKIKGPSRPIYNEMQRAFLLLSNSCVNLVFLFDGKNLSNEIEAIQPDIYAKSGDYSLESINHEERIALEKANASVKFVDFIEGISTSETISRISNLGS